MTKEVAGLRFRDAELAKNRFVAVKEGEKMCVDHDTRYSDPGDVPGENYGIYCDEEDQLVVLDVDVHRGGDVEHEDRALVAIANLGFTLRVRSPHADPDIGGHRIFKLSGDETPAELFDRVFGRKNPVATWGEVVSKNKYVVGPGSQLDGCTKEWCDRCEKPDGGHYDVEDDREIATVEPDELVEALAADPDLSRNDQPDHSDVTGFDDDSSPGEIPRREEDYDELSREQIEELLEAIPGTQHFDDWIRTAYAVHSWDSSEKGKQLFEEWSRSNPKWEEGESQRQIDYIWKNGDDTDSDRNAGVGTLVHVARENDYDGDLGGGSKKPDETAAADWSHVRTVYEYAQQDQNYAKGNGRLAAADMLEKETSWMYVLESEKLWVYEEETGRYDKYGRSHAAKRLEHELGEHYTQAERREVIGRLKARNQVHRDVINARERDDPLLCVANGVVNLRTGELVDHGPEYRFVRGLDVEYDPGTAEPDKIIEFIDDITERVADRDTLLDHLAHGLMPGHPYRAFVVCYGPGGNGKTQVSELFRGFVGRRNAAAVEIDELAAGDFATGDLPGKFLNWGDDMAGDGGGKLSDLSILKKATGGSEIRANEKYEKTFNFKSEAAMFFSANEPPRIGEQKSSIQDRIYPIEMPYRFTSNPDPDDPLQKEKTPNVSQTLLDDEGAMKGLLLLAVKHAQELIENRGRYSQPETPAERLEKYNRSADPIVKFGGKILEEASGDYRVRKDDAYRVYRAFTESIEERSASERGFKRQLPGAVPMEIEEARSRALATNDDDSDRVRCWKRLKWTETAKTHMPEWMLERYTDHFEGDGSDEESEENAQSSGSTPTPDALAALSTGRGIELTAELVNVSDGEYNRVAQGELEGEVGTRVGFVIPGSNEHVFEGRQGETVRITDATLRTDDDGLKEVVVNDATGVEFVDKPDADQSSLDEPEKAPATDGGSGVDGTRVQRVTETVREAEQAVGVAYIIQHTEGKAEPLREAIRTAVESGRINEWGDDKYASGE